MDLNVCFVTRRKLHTVEARTTAFKKNLLIVLERNADRLDLKSYDVVVIPILESHHYYLVCFDLREPSIEVIDNMRPKFAWVSMKDGNSFTSKGTPNKIKHIVCAYMRSVKHLSAQALSSETLSKKEIG
ncbi:putative papain-like cysteine peptidase superfamily [Helianthus anomalus]